MDAWGSLFTLLASQHQVVAIRQVAELGLDPRTFLRHANRQGWVGHGGTLWSPPGTTLDTWGLAMAAALRAGDQATVTGMAGLHVHGLDVPFPTPVRVVTPMSRHAVRTADPDRVRIIASRTLRDDDLTVRRRVPVAEPNRCFLDMVLPPTPAITPVRETLVTAFQRRLTSEGSIRARLGLARGMPGRGLLLRALDDLTTGADSPFSDRVVRRLRGDGFRPDRAPVSIQTPGRVLHPDITFCRQRVCIECDGLRFHSSQKQLAIDHRKDRRYWQADWTVFRIGWWEFDHGWNAFANDLRAALIARS